ncbi:hypothetical protein ACFX13_005686 [Malus domestica]
MPITTQSRRAAAPPQPAAASHLGHSADPLSFFREAQTPPSPVPRSRPITTLSRRGCSRLMWKLFLIWELVSGYTA